MVNNSINIKSFSYLIQIKKNFIYITSQIKIIKMDNSTQVCLEDFKAMKLNESGLQNNPSIVGFVEPKN